MNRREFLAATAAICSTGWFSLYRNASAREESPLKITRLTIPLPIKEKFTALHISDTHLTYVDERDSDQKRKRADERLEVFGGQQLEMLQASLRYAREKNALLLHTGDMIDFVTVKNLDLTREAFTKSDSFVSAGNHDFYPIQGDGAREDEEYKALSFDTVQAAYPNNLRFSARTIGGVNFIAFDDVFYYVADDLIDRFKAEAAKGLPIVAMCHCPLYTRDLFEYCAGPKHDNAAYIVGASDEEMANYPEWCFQWGYNEQRTTPTTRAFLDYLTEEPLLKAILCGHLHFPWQGMFSRTATQYIAGGNFMGHVNEIEFVPEA